MGWYEDAMSEDPKIKARVIKQIMWILVIMGIMLTIIGIFTKNWSLVTVTLGTYPMFVTTAWINYKRILDD